MRWLVALVLAGAVSLAAGAGAPGTATRLKVAYVTDFAAIPNPHDLRGAALLGFQRAVRNFKVDARVVQFPPLEGATPTLTRLAEERYDLVLVGEVRSGFDLEDVVRVARKFPSTKFVITDPPILETWPKNVQGAIWHVEQPAYLAGYLAGLMEERRTGKDVVGSVGGFKIVSVDAFIAGFEAGAKLADPGITTLRAYTLDFVNPAKCRTVALSMVARGAGALFNVGGLCGIGTLETARQRRVWGIGVDVDQSFLGQYILTSVLKRFDVQAYDTVRALVEGRLRTGGNTVWDLENGAVGLGPISSRVPKPIIERLDEIRRRIASGAIRVPRKVSRT